MRKDCRTRSGGAAPRASTARAPPRLQTPEISGLLAEGGVDFRDCFERRELVDKLVEHQHALPPHVRQHLQQLLAGRSTGAAAPPSSSSPPTPSSAGGAGRAPSSPPSGARQRRIAGGRWPPRHDVGAARWRVRDAVVAVAASLKLLAVPGQRAIR